MNVAEALTIAAVADYEVAAKGEIEALRTLASAVERVRDLHIATEPGEWICEACAEGWPCTTIRALIGEAS